MSANNSTKPSTISYGTTNSGRNSVLILPDDYKFKGDGSDSHRWREVKDQVLNKSMSGQGFKMMSLLETKPVPETKTFTRMQLGLLQQVEKSPSKRKRRKLRKSR